MSDWLAIVNPRSGGAARRGFRGVLDRLNREARKVVFTERPGHATDLARDAHDFEALVVMGGDGTIFEVLQGMDLQSQTLAIIPMGRGNSLARDLGLYPPSNIALPDAVTASRIDLIEVAFHDNRGDHSRVLSASTIALGYPAEVAGRAGRDFRRFGPLCYAVAAGCVVPGFRKVRLCYAGEPVIEKRVTGFIASNTRHAANFVAFPEARANDGSFEAMELMSGFAKQAIHNLSSLSRMQFYSPPARRKLTDVRVTSEEPQELLIDGELFPGIVSIEKRILPSALVCASNRSSE